MSSPMLTTAVISPGATHLDHPAQQPGGADAAGQRGDHGTRPGPGAGVGHRRRLPVAVVASRRRCRRSRNRPDDVQGSRRAAGATSDRRRPDRLSVGFDATPLLGRPTGVGVFCAGALSGLADRHDLDVSAFAVSWRRRHGIAARVPTGVGRRAAADAGPAAACRVGPLEPSAGRVVRRAAATSSTGPTSWSRRPAGRPGGDRPRPHRGPLPRAVRRAHPGLPGAVRRAVADGAWVHTPSRFVADEVVAEFGVDPERVRAVHHGVPPLPATGRPAYAAARAARRVPPLRPGRRAPSSPARTTRCWSGVRRGRGRPPRRRAGDRRRRRLGGGPVLPRPWHASPARSRIVRTGYLDDRPWPRPCTAPRCWPTRRATRGSASRRCRPWPPGSRWWRPPPAPSPRWSGDGPGSSDPGDGDALAARLVEVLAGGRAVDALVARGRARGADVQLGGVRRRSGRPLPRRAPHGRQCRGGGPGGEQALRVLLLAEQLRRSAAGGSAPTCSASSRVSTS